MPVVRSSNTVKDSYRADRSQGTAKFPNVPVNTARVDG